MFRNIVEILADETVGDNVRMRDHVREQVEHEKRLREHRRRSELAIAMLVDGGIDRDQVMAKLDDQMLYEERIRILIVDTVAPTTSYSEPDLLAVHWRPPT